MKEILFLKTIADRFGGVRERSYIHGIRKNKSYE